MSRDSNHLPTPRPASVEVFPWNPSFETGLVEIDAQHRRLVGLLNGLVAHVSLDSDGRSFDAVLAELMDYTATHFRDEEALWLEYFAGDPWETGHHRAHGNFAGRVQQLLADAARQPLESQVAELVTFLTTWLSKHILESDKRLAMVVLAMRAGMTRDQAKAHATTLVANGSSSLSENLVAMSEAVAGRTVLLMQEMTRRRQAELDLHATHIALQEATRKLERLQRLLSHARAPLVAYASVLAAGELPQDEERRRELARGLREALGVLAALDDGSSSRP